MNFSKSLFYLIIFMGILNPLLSFSAKTKPQKIFTLPHREASLPNGLRIYLIKYPSPGVVAYQIHVRAGSRNEVEKGKTGFAHFFEHLMFRGTKHLSGKEFGDLYTRLGCEYNAWTSNDMTSYHGVVAKTYLPQILHAEADRFMNLSFDEKLLRDEAGAVLGEYNKNVAQPENVLEEKLLETAFKVHTYTHTTMGYKEDILKYTERYNDVWPFFKRYYRPSNVSVVLVGDIDFESSLALIKSKFGEWKDPKIDLVTIPQEPEQKEARSAEIKLGKPAQTRLTVAYKIPAFSTKNRDSATQELLAEILFSTTSEFQKTYRFEKKWVDAVMATSGGTLFPMQSVDPGLWAITVRLSQAGEGKDKEVISAIEKTVAQVRDATTPELDKKLLAAKKRFRNSAVTGWFHSPDSLATQIAVYTTFEPDLAILDRAIQRLDEVSTTDLQNYSKKYLTDLRKTTVILKGN